MKHLFILLMGLISIFEMWAYNPYDSDIHTVGKFVYRVHDVEGMYATLIDVKPGIELKGEVTIPGSITVDGNRYVVNHVGDVYPSPQFFKCDRAFKDFPEITRINIPSTVTDIGYMEFLGCTGINEFHVNANNENFKDEDGVLLYHINENSSWRLFRLPPARPKTKYTLPDYVTRIEQCAFADNKTLRQIVLPTDFIFTDPLWAWGNKSIREIDVTKTRYYISRDGIIYEEWEEGVELVACPPGLKLDNYTLPDDCHTVGGGAFCNSSISKIQLNKSVEVLHEYAFAGSDIEELEIEENLLTEHRNINGLCVKAAKLKKLHIIGECTATLDSYSFAMCSNLEEVILDSYVNLLTGAFFGCTSLKEFPFNRVYSMEGAQENDYFGDGRQFQSSGIIQVDFPAHLFKVPNYCFSNCPDLKEVRFNQDGTATKEIEDGAFKNCVSLETITLNGINYVGGGAFEGTPINKIIVPNRKDNEGKLRIGLSFDFLPDTKWYIDSPCLEWVSADGSNNLTTATYIISTAEKTYTAPNEWKQLYCPAGMKEWYEKLYEGHIKGGPVTELFTLSEGLELPSVIIQPNPDLNDINFDVTSVFFNGKQGVSEGNGIWTYPKMTSLSGVEIKVDYLVDDVPMSTSYPADFITGVTDTSIPVKHLTGIYDVSGRYAGENIFNVISGIYILRFSDGSSQKIIKR